MYQVLNVKSMVESCKYEVKNGRSLKIWNPGFRCLNEDKSRC